ncbi:MAG TPA: hypothetical protein VFZ30_12140 [Acidimicrobiales bacterium]
MRLDVSEAEAVRRVAARDRDRQLTADVERNRTVWRAVYEGPGTDRRIDLTIDTDAQPPAGVTDDILAACRRHAG